MWSESTASMDCFAYARNDDGVGPSSSLRGTQATKQSIPPSAREPHRTENGAWYGRPNGTPFITV
jgi:hypothetical protein